jgi:hypothetical protein
MGLVWDSGVNPTLIITAVRFQEKRKTTGEQGWEDVLPGTALEGLLLLRPPGKDYRFLKIVTQATTPEQIAGMGNDRARVLKSHTPAFG